MKVQVSSCDLGFFFLYSGIKKKKHPVSGGSVVGHALLTRELSTHFTTMLSRKAPKHEEDELQQKTRSGFTVSQEQEATKDH